MKKILTGLACGIMFSSALTADIARVEAGAGAWMQTPSGTITSSQGDGLLKLDGTYTSDESQNTETYVWLLVKHPLPIVPNLRLEYVSLSDKGAVNGTIDGSPVSATSKATLDMKQYDIIPYYNILDNTAWTTIDLGLDLKIIDEDAKVDGLLGVTPEYTSSETVVVPMGYVRARVEIPATDIGLESDVKYITYDGSTIYDIRAKVDYTLDISPVIQPGLELGYRIQKLDLKSDDAKGDLTFAGVYAGVMLRF